MKSRNSKRTLIQNIPQPKRAPRKSERTREDILSAAVEFLWTHPFRDLTVSTLMSGTNAGRSAFYQYFDDLHQLMEALLAGVGQEIFAVATPWFEDEMEPLAALKVSLEGLVNVGYERGPILRAVSDAVPTDANLEKTWFEFLKQFDDAVAARIESHQSEGLIEKFEARPVAAALNRMDAALLIEAFGRRPRKPPEPVLEAITRVWTTTLYRSFLETDEEK